MSGIVILVLSVLAVSIVYPIIAGINVQTIDINLGFGATPAGGNWTGRLNGTVPATNASLAVLSGANIVMGINPLAALVAVAAGILLLLMGVFSPGVKQANI